MRLTRTPWYVTVIDPVTRLPRAFFGRRHVHTTASSAYNGDSTITQSVTIPSGSSKLTFWYQPHCPDTLTYDQIQMQIRSTSGSTLATVLNVCSNSGAWTQKSYDMSTEAVSRTLVTGIRGAREVVLDDSSHTPVLEETDRYLRVVGAFLREHDTTTTRLV